MASDKQVLRHVVLFKFQESTTPADVTNLANEFRALATVKLPQVKDFEWGTNVSKENLNQGFTHCFVLTFTSEEDRDIYVDHKDHLAFVALLKPHLAGALVVDFWATR